MPLRRIRAAVPLAALVLASLAGVSAAAPPDAGDTRLAAARRYVESSGRYLHHSRLARGMKGYGLSVFAGTKIERFDVKILSVMKNFGPHQDVILAVASGCGLEESGVIQGMSGSPIYIKDPRDGKHKIIGALAYGWSFQNEPVFGIQPITQMIAVPGFLPEKALDEKDRKDRKPPKAGPAGKGDRARPAKPGGRSGWVDGQAVLDAGLAPEKRDFLDLLRLGRRSNRREASGRPRLAPLSTPLMISGGTEATVNRAAEAFAAAGLVPLRSGGAGEADARAAGKVRLAPGSSVSVPLVSGDADWTAVGTVTDVVDGKVLAFGHAFFSAGPMTLPMGTAYIHTVISSQWTSFKLGSTLKVTGAIQHDQAVGVFGRRGAKYPSLPMGVRTRWRNDDRQQSYSYRVVEHGWLTAPLVSNLLFEAALGWRELPEEHTVGYRVQIEFPELGTLTAENLYAGYGLGPAASDLLRPIVVMEANPFGPPVRPKSVDVELTIESKNRSAGIVDLQLDGKAYRPGETIRGHLVVKPHRAPRRRMPVRFELPEDLPEGEYRLNALDVQGYLSTLQQEQPDVFRPDSAEGTFQALRTVLAARADRLYLHVALPAGGVAIDSSRLPDLPASKVEILGEARKLDASVFRKSLIVEEPMEMMLNGSAGASFTVRRKLDETLIREESK